MIDRYFRTIELPITIEQFHELPTNSAYKYEYFDNAAWLTPRPKGYLAALDLRPMGPAEPVEVHREPVSVRPLRETDWDALPKLFAHAFHRTAPFAGLDDATGLEAAAACLGKTREGGDGPLVASACFAAVDDRDRPLGAALVTRLEDEDRDWYADLGPAPAAGHPHLTWIFVAPMMTRHGVGSLLLSAVVDALRAAGDTLLASTFLLGNESSTLWHWRSGFRLLGYPGSPRQIGRQVRENR